MGKQLMRHPCLPPKVFVVFLLGTRILCLYCPQQLGLCRLPLSASLSGKNSFLGPRVGYQRSERELKPLLLSLFFFLWELSVLKTSFLRTIFFWVKGEKCSVPSKWNALGLPAPGTFPRPFLPLREEAAPCKGGEEEPGGGPLTEREEGSRKESTSYSETMAVRVRKPEGLFVLDQVWRLEQDWVRK